MNWRAIHLALLLLLIVLNLGLFGYKVYLNTERYVVPEERISLLREQYLREGYMLPDSIPRKQYPVQRLILEKEDLEARADGFWNEEYEKSYMIGSKVLYTCGSEILTIDRDKSTLQYTQNQPRYDSNADAEDEERLAMAFARMLMQEGELELIQQQKGSEGARIYTFCESYEGQLIFCNGISVMIYHGAVLGASMQQYRIRGYEEEERYIYPVDEVLFASLDELGESREQEKLLLHYGYDAVQGDGETYYGAPQILICRENGSNLMVNQYTVEFDVLQFR